MKKKKAVVILAGFVFVGVFLLFLRLDVPVQAAAFIDNTLNQSHLYSRYGLLNYQLDFYVDSSGGWLPWNWGESVGQSVMYGLYAFTNVLWMLSCLLAQGAGYIVQESFRLDFIGDMSDSIGKNMQTLAGVSPSGISMNGFYSGCLLLLILVVGIYVLYVGVFKREATKAISAVTSFIGIFLLSAVFIAYAPESVSKINDFSKDISSTALNLGLKMMGDQSGAGDTIEGSTDSIRDTLWRIQVDAPWELLQFGSVGEVDSARVNALKSVSPEEEDGKSREDAVKAEVTEQENMNLSTPKVQSRLGVTLFLFIMSIAISIFVFLLSGFVILTQILFIVFAVYLPITFLLSMIPGFNGMSIRAVLSLFNMIMLRVGITLVVVTTFSLSYLLYTKVGDYPFFLIMFIQIVVFLGTFLFLPEILRMVTLPVGDSGMQGSGRRMMAGFLVQSRMYRQMRKLGKSKSAGGSGGSGGGGSGTPGGSSGSGASGGAGRSGSRRRRSYGGSGGTSWGSGAPGGSGTGTSGSTGSGAGASGSTGEYGGSPSESSETSGSTGGTGTSRRSYRNTESTSWGSTSTSESTSETSGKSNSAGRSNTGRRNYRDAGETYGTGKDGSGASGSQNESRRDTERQTAESSKRESTYRNLEKERNKEDSNTKKRNMEQESRKHISRGREPERTEKQGKHLDEQKLKSAGYSARRNVAEVPVQRRSGESPFVLNARTKVDTTGGNAPQKVKLETVESLSRENVAHKVSLEGSERSSVYNREKKFRSIREKRNQDVEPMREIRERQNQSASPRSKGKGKGE